MDEDSLENSIKLYKSQLEQVESALTSQSDGDKSDLLQLQCDLQEIIQLTEESLLSLKKSNLLDFLDEVTGTCGQSSKKEDYLNAELAAFKECLPEDVTPEGNDTNDVDEVEEDVGEEEDELCGTQCRLLYSQEWGASQYHNAIVLNTEKTECNQVKVRILFCNPTHQSMVPCPYFLEGNCKFSEDDCRFSHGHIVNVAELESFKEPDFSELETGSKCLAKYDDKIWHRATVETIDLENHQISIQYENYNESATLNLESILPIESIEYSSSSDSEDDAGVILPGSSTSTPEDTGTDSPVLLWQPERGSAIGEWEQYTSGIGSKLMLKMGYEYGKGLGKNGEGRVEPVEAVIVPQGKSLDHCMELKERKRLKIVGGKNQKGLLDVNNQTRRRKENVFDFLNSKLDSHKTKGNKLFKKASIQKHVDIGSTSKNQSSSNTGRKLNIKLVQTQEEIRKVEKHLVHKKNALQRNSRDKTTVTHIQEQINEMEKYLLRLNSSENNLQKNRNSRNQHKKLTIF